MAVISVLGVGCGGSTGTTPPVSVQTAAPIFTPAAGNYTSAQTVTISDSTAGAVIYYTTDGSTPTTASKTYAAAIPVSATTTIEAIALASGDTVSSSSSAVYTITLPVAAAPTFSPAAGKFTSAQTVTLGDSTTAAVIYFTTDGSTPTTASPAYSAPISVSSTTTIKAIASAAGYTPSSVASATYTINLAAAATPTFSVATGTYTSAQTVTLADATTGAKIYYTIDGTTPTTSSTLYSAAISISATTTVKAIATASGYTTSAVASATYTINLAAAGTPTFSVTAGTYTSAQTVALADETSGAKIYYTIDGTTPTTSSTAYSAAISVATTTTIKAIATASGYTTSAVASATYTINIPTVATPTFTPAAGTYTTVQSVSIADTTSGAKIYYTTDGTTPTASSTLYASAISISATTTVKAIATASGDTTSAVASATYTINLAAAATPTFSVAAGTYASAQTVAIADATSGAKIYYTTDGTAPTASSTLYTAAISVSATTTIRAIATASGYSTSAIATALYTIGTGTAAPTISPNGGSFTSAQTVTLADSTASAAIYYTLDGTTPTSASTLYSAPFQILAAGATTVNAIAILSGNSSSVATAIFTLTYPVNFQPTYSYKNVQIVGGGYVDGLYFHPKQQGLMYAHTDIGGAYRWNNVTGGDSQWIPLNDFIGAFNSGFDLAIQSLAIDPNDATRLYLAIGAYTESYGHNGAILASSDMGKTFTAIPLSIKLGGNDNGRNDGDRLVVDPSNSKHLYLGTFINGLYESLDQAATWNQVASFPITGVTSNPEDPEAGVIFEQFVAASGTVANGNTKTVYYGVSSPTTGVYVSNDGGATFAGVPGQPTGYYPNAEALDTVNNILYVTYALNSGCTSNCDNAGPGSPNAGQVWSYKLPTSSVPNGLWTNITPPETTPTGGAYGWNSVVVDPNHSNVIMVMTLNKYYPNPGDDIFRSTDSGATWFNIGTNEVRDISLAPWMAPFEPGNWLNHLVVDPFDSNHAMYGNGQNIWATNNLESADGVATNTMTTVHGNATNWFIGAQGLEETDIIQLVSPPSGPAHLFSEMGDLGGFTHTDLDVSPAVGQQHPPLFTTGTSTDFAQNNPLLVVRVGRDSNTAGTFNQLPGSLVGGYSTDGGVTWTQFANNPTNVVNGQGTIAISADGATIVWMPGDSGLAAQYSTDNGTTWTAATGPTQVPTQYGNLPLLVAADRFNAKKFYLFDTTDNNGSTPVYVSVDSGHTFTAASNPNNYDTGFAVSPKAEGDLWFYGYNGLYHSTDSGATITQVSGIDQAFGIGFGAAAPGASTPAIYFIGHVSSDTVCVPSTTTPFTVQTQCVYRSVDGGTTFVLINDFAHQYGSFDVLAGDPRVFGRVYLGTSGRGIIEADSPN